MSVFVFEGVVGASKTYHAVAAILAHLSKGGIVSTNISLVWEACEVYCRRRYGVEVRREQLVMIEDVSRFNVETPEGSDSLPTLSVLDEVHLWFFCRDYQNVQRSVQDFITQSRKLNIDIIMIAQHADNIDKIFRRQVERYFMFRDLRKWKIPGLGFRWPLPQFLVIELERDRKTVVERKWEPIDTEIFGCYRSKQILKPVLCGAKKERVVLNKVRTGGMKMKMAFAAILLLAGVWGYRAWALARGDRVDTRVLAIEGERDLWKSRAEEAKRYIDERLSETVDAVAEPDYECAAVVDDGRTIRLYNKGEWMTVTNRAEWEKMLQDKLRERELKRPKERPAPKSPFAR